ncbi:hypothetical protein PQQ65_27395 [Paraburkholderia strydomiana]|uniref:hypothetical protein n=1 Tax=Paraburkholderia strydomiana TaxID=1245417 RepID=UPI0038BD2609
MNGTAGDTVDGQITPGEADAFALVISGDGVPAALRAWLARAGRFINAATTNPLVFADDAQALALFLRDRAQRSPHTLRAYGTELRRLIDWCETHRRGLLSDLTRDDLLAFRRSMNHLGPRPTAHTRSHPWIHRPCTRPAATQPAGAHSRSYRAYSATGRKPAT